MRRSPKPHTVESHQLQLESSQAERQGGTASVVRSLQENYREGSDGDGVLVDSEVLFQFLDEQSRSLRDFLQIARGVGNAKDPGRMEG